MVSPYAKQDVTLVVRDTLVSVPYVDLTLDIMAHFGVEVVNDGYRRFSIRGQQCYTGQAYTVEGDASSATYFWGLAALLGQSLCVTNVPPTSAQGDVRFLDVMERMGCTISRGERLQVTEFPDGLQINGHPEALHGTEIATYDDHRMAMCFGMAGARLPGIRIQEPGCVAKTYPGFWEDLQRVGVHVQQV